MRTLPYTIALVLAAWTNVVSAQTADVDHGGFFLNGRIGRSNLEKQGLYSADDTGAGANLGYRWATSSSFAFGVEGGYTDLGTFKNEHPFDPAEKRATVDGCNLGVNALLNITPSWYVSGRFGLFRADAKGSYYMGLDTLYAEGSSTKYYGGVGFGYYFGNHFSVGLNYDYYRVEVRGLSLNPNLVSLGAEYRF